MSLSTITLPTNKSVSVVDDDRRRVRQSEKGLVLPVIVLNADGSAYDLTGKDIIFSENKASGKVVVDDGNGPDSGSIKITDAKAGKFEYTLQKQIYVDSGTCWFEIVSGNTVIDTTKDFYFDVDKDATIRPSNDNYISQMAALENHFKGVIQKSEDALNQTTSALTKQINDTSDNLTTTSNKAKQDALDAIKKAQDTATSTLSLLNSQYSDYSKKYTDLEAEMKNKLQSVDNDAKAEVQKIKEAATAQSTDISTDFEKLKKQWTDQINTEDSQYQTDKNTRDADYQADKKARDTDYQSDKEKRNSDFATEQRSRSDAFSTEKSTRDADWQKQSKSIDTDYKTKLAQAIKDITDQRDAKIKQINDEWTAKKTSLQNDLDEFKNNLLNQLNDAVAKLNKLSDTDLPGLESRVKAVKDQIDKLNANLSTVNFDEYARKDDVFTKDKITEMLNAKANSSDVVLKEDYSQAYNAITNQLGQFSMILSDEATDLNSKIEDAGKVKTISVNGGDKINPDSTGNADLTIPLSQYVKTDTMSQVLINLDTKITNLNNETGEALLQHIKKKANIEDVYSKKELDPMLAEAGKVKTVSLNGGAKVDPDANGNINLTVPQPDLSNCAQKSDVQSNKQDISNLQNQVSAAQNDIKTIKDKMDGMVPKVEMKQADFNKIKPADNTLYIITD